MTRFKTALSAFALAALAAGGIGAATLMPADLHAQPAQPAAAEPDHKEGWFQIDPLRRAEGRIAYLKAVLKITPAQEEQFDKLAQAMRANAQERAKAFEQFRQNRDKAKNAVERLEARERFTEMRAQQEQRALAAFKPLYDSLSPEQKQVADALTAPHWGHHHRG